MRRRSVAAAIAACGAVVTLASCAVLGPDADPGPSDQPAPTTSGQPQDGTATVPPGFLECGKPTSDEDLQLADVDLSAATWSTPAGYQDAVGYVEDNPVEAVKILWVVEPTNPPMPRLNVLNVVLYVGLQWDADECGRVPLSAVNERLASYREQIAARPITDAEMTTLAGLPALEQYIGLASYDYHGYWLFSETQLLHVYCQWTDQQYQPDIEDGCASLVASVDLP